MKVIEDLINNIVSIYSPSTGADLLGMQIDVRNCFDTTLDFVSQDNTDNPHCMITLNLEVQDDVSNLGDTLHSLNKLWDSIKYQYFEARSVEIFKDKAILRFVTIIEKEAFYVTGKVIVSGTKYELLANKYNPDLIPHI